MEFINLISLDSIQVFIVLGGIVMMLPLLLVPVMEVIASIMGMSTEITEEDESWDWATSLVLSKEAIPMPPASSGVLETIVSNEAGGLGLGWRGNVGRGFRVFGRDESPIVTHDPLAVEVTDNVAYIASPALIQIDVEADVEIDRQRVARWALLVGIADGIIRDQEELQERLDKLFDENHRRLVLEKSRLLQARLQAPVGVWDVPTFV